MRKALVCALAALAVFSGTASAVTFDDVPAREISLGAQLPQVPTETQRLLSFASGDTVLLLELQDFRLLAARSTDGGATFAPAALVAGGPAGRDVVWADATRSADGRVYVGLTSAAPDGDLGLQLLWSGDMGLSWNGPYDALQPAQLPHDHVFPSFGAQLFSVAANASGRVAIAFAAWRTSYYYVVTSPDAGATWTDPVQVDARLQPPYYSSSLSSTWYHRLVTAVDSLGIIHAAFVQYAQIPGPSSRVQVLYTRSLDGGHTFAAETSLTEALHPNGGRTARGVDLAVAPDDSVVVAMTETSRLVVGRSVDHGASFSLRMDQATSSSTTPVVSIAGSRVLVTASDVLTDGFDGKLIAARSGDGGETFEAPATVTSSTARGSWSAARTADGRWVLAWKDAGADGTRERTRVFCASAPDGAAWAAPVRLESGGPVGFSDLVRPAVAATPADGVVVAWADGRDWNHASRVAYATRGSAATLLFAPDAVLGAFPREGAYPNASTPAIETDGVSRVFVAYAARSAGPQSDVFVQRSLDRGRTFDAPRRVSGGVAGQRAVYYPQLRAGSGGALYLAYIASENGATRLKFKASPDGGVTWPESEALDEPASGGIMSVGLDEARPGEVLLAFTDQTTIKVARSTDAGRSFAVQTVATQASGYGPALCSDGARAVLVYSDESYSALGMTSGDGGATWSTAQALMQTGYATWADIGIDCDGSGRAVAAWAVDGAPPQAARFDGAAWHDAVDLPGDYRVSSWQPTVAWLGGERVGVAFDDGEAAYLAVSADAGATFDARVRLDEDAPRPEAESSWAKVVSDHAGGTWAFFYDQSAGYAYQVLGRYSADAGATFGPLYRLGDDQPPGARTSSVPYPAPPGAAVPGAAWVVSASQRRSRRYDTIVAAFDVGDFDRDGVAATADCADGNPDAWGAPLEVAGLHADAVPGATRLSWASQDAAAGPATSYDVVGGSTAALRASAAYGGASCVAPGVPDTPHDAGGTPDAGDALWWLVRARNACGTGTFGDSSLVPDARDALDAAAPCP